MRTMDDAVQWWEWMAGPSLLIKEIANALRFDKSVIIQTATPLPWVDEMQTQIKSELEYGLIRTIDWESVKSKEHIAPRLLEQINPSLWSQCPARYKDQIKFLKDKQCLAGIVLWFKAKGIHDMSMVARFISDYRGDRMEKCGCFVLELRNGLPQFQLSSSVTSLNAEDYIRWGNIRLFASTIADTVSTETLPETIRSYAAAVCAQLSGSRAELTPILLRNIDFLFEDPADGYLRLYRDGMLPEDLEEPDRDDLDLAVWKAQLQVAFPGIEMERLSLIERHYDQIDAAMHTEYYDPKNNVTGYISQHDDILDAPTDLELGTLLRMTQLRCADDHDERLLLLPDKDILDWLRTLRDLRNALAHHSVCAPQDICYLLDKLDQFEQAIKIG